MKKNIWCFFGFHKWTKWKFIKEINSYEDELHSTCIRCGKIDIYVGMTEECIVSGEKSPYTMKC
jgi:hypothetical protein